MFATHTVAKRQRIDPVGVIAAIRQQLPTGET
jgi:hypothetical protein